MENIDFATLFQGFGTMMESGYLLASARVFLILLGLLLIYLVKKEFFLYFCIQRVSDRGA